MRFSRTARAAFHVFACICVLFIAAPLLTVVLFSFNDFPYYSLPLRGLTLSWYKSVFQNEEFINATRETMVLALPVTVLSATMGTTFAFGLMRLRNKRLRVLLAGAGFLPMAMPGLVLGIMFLLLFSLVDMRLGHTTAIIAQTTFVTPFVSLLVLTRLLTFDDTLPAAARDLGARPAQSFLRVTLPLTRGAIQGGVIIAFLLAANEFIIGFQTSAGFNTLTGLVFALQKDGIQPDVLAYSTLVLAVAIAALIVVRRVLVGALRVKEARRT